MADYWKSQPRKFCQYCKCWIADNKPSVEFHERGKNHKENVAAKISEIKKKSIDKAKQEARMSKEFAAMEEAALKAYEEDLKRMERESTGLPAQVTTEPQPQAKPQGKPQAGPQLGPQTGPKAGPKAGPQLGAQTGPQAGPHPGPHAKPQAKKQKKQEKMSKKFRGQTEAQVWVEGQTEDGHTYYYNTITGESKWENPEGFRGQNPEGFRGQNPEGFRGQNPPSAQPGQTKSSSGCPWKEAVSPEGYTYYYKSETGETSWEKPAGFPSIEPPGTEVSQEEPPPPGGEESSSVAPVPQEAEVPEQESQQSKAPKISFRKRKAEAEPSETEGEDKASDDAPKEEAREMKKEEEVQSTTAEPEEKKKVEVAPVRRQARRPKTANPYGTWEEIQEEVDPYSKVDLQLPRVAGSSSVSVSAPAAPPPEPKPKFRERFITSLGVEGGSASFRKNKTQNGKSRSLRRRDDDDD